jgi:hypothetical protein
LFWTVLEGNIVFQDGDNFCKAFAGSGVQVHTSHITKSGEAMSDMKYTGVLNSMLKLIFFLTTLELVMMEACSTKDF